MQDGFNNITNDINELKNHIIKNLIDTNEKLQKEIESLENELLNTKKATQKNKIDIETNNQYGRRNNIEISGIPNEVSDEQLEEKVKEILSKAGIDIILDNDIEPCNRLPATRNNKNKKNYCEVC